MRTLGNLLNGIFERRKYLLETTTESDFGPFERLLFIQINKLMRNELL